MKIKTSRNVEISLSLTDVVYSCPRFCNVGNMYFNAICENKVLPKISEFTVLALTIHHDAKWHYI